MLDSATPMSAKTPHAPPTPPSMGTTPSLPVPDLDRSAISIAKDHITSGSTSSTVSLSGDYKDASGKVIRRYIHAHTLCIHNIYLITILYYVILLGACMYMYMPLFAYLHIIALVLDVFLLLREFSIRG